MWFSLVINKKLKFCNGNLKQKVPQLGVLLCSINRFALLKIICDDFIDQGRRLLLREHDKAVAYSRQAIHAMQLVDIQMEAAE